jgi:multicomponent Na+:H+ antiporter subunit D
MNSWFPPALFFFLGGLIILPFKGKIRQFLLLLIPGAALLYLFYLPYGTSSSLHFLDYCLIPLKVDKLSKVFGYIFIIASWASFLFALHIKDNIEQTSSMFYVGGALGVTFAGDFFTLYIFWEIMAVASVMLIWSRKTEKSIKAGFRYILVHVVGGLVLLAGIIVYVSKTGNLEVCAFHNYGWGSCLILTAFLLNAACPPFNAWLPDAYPEATATGGVFLSAFTTKSAVYTLIRVFPGWEILIYLGTIMVIFGILYALLENDARRILAYSIVNQVGFMVVGIGIGTQLALNGAAAHAFCHIIYKGLLWMSAGAVLHMTGKTKCTELGALVKTMPYTALCGIIGAMAISGFPLTSGFVSKTMIVEASLRQNMTIIWLLLEVASAGVFLHAGVKYPWFVFFDKDRGVRAKEPPVNMMVAMGLLSFACIFLGIYPRPLYNILMYPVNYDAYTASHVVWMLQLLLFSGLAFFVFLKFLKRTDTISLDTDWLLYRKPVQYYGVCSKSIGKLHKQTLAQDRSPIVSHGCFRPDCNRFHIDSIRFLFPSVEYPKTINLSHIPFLTFSGFRLIKNRNYSGSKLQGSRLPWRCLPCIPIITMLIISQVLYNEPGKPGLGQGFKVGGR